MRQSSSVKAAVWHGKGLKVNMSAPASKNSASVRANKDDHLEERCVNCNQLQ